MRFFMTKYKAVIFDVDGTLLDTREGIIDAVKHTINKLNLAPLADNLLCKFVGPPIQNSFMLNYGFSSIEAQNATNVFREYYAKFSLFKAIPYDGIFDIMKELKQQGVKIGIATYKRNDYAVDLLKYFGFHKYYDVVCGADDKNVLKKSDIIQNNLIQLNIQNYAEAVMIGDSENDATGAEKIGLDFIGVIYGFGFKDESDVKKYKNTGFAKDVKSLSEILGLSMEPIVANNPEVLAYINYAKNIQLFRDSFNKHQQGEQNGNTTRPNKH